MMNNVKYLSFALILAFSACKSGSASSQEPSEKQDTVKIFNLPQIPVVLNTVEQRTDYMVKHYWDRFDFSDTTYINQAEVPEQAWVDYCALACGTNCHERNFQPGGEEPEDASFL